MKNIGIKYKLSERTTFFLNLISIMLLMILFLQIMPSAVLAENLIGIVDVPRQRHISAAVYNSEGERVKELLAFEPTGSNTKIELRWDGKDEYGRLLPTDKVYQWRALMTDATFFVEGCIGNTGNPWSDGIIHNGNVNDIVFDSKGNGYTVSYWEEAHNEIRKLDSDWKVLWHVSLVGPQQVATDDTNLYVAALVEGEDRIYTFHTEKGEGDEYFVVNKASQGTEVNHAIRGLDVDSTRLWITDYYHDRVLVYTKAGTPLAQFTVNDPEGIAVQSEPGKSSGAIWVAHDNKVSKYTYTLAYNDFTEVASISGLNHPTSVDIGGPSNHLFVVEAGNDRTREYDISSTPTPAGNFHLFGTGFTRGLLDVDEFWQLNDVAVAPDGRVAVSDAGNFRIQLFNANKKLIHSEHIAWQPAPFVDRVTQSVHRVLSFGFEYEVDLSGAIHPEWMAGGGNGTWRLVANWWDKPWAGMFYWRRVSLNVPGLGLQDYLICMQRENGSLGGFIIYHVSQDGATSRRSAIVARSWIGENGELPSTPGRFVWTDINGDEKVEESEVTWKDPKGKGQPYTLWCPSMTVDTKGNLYYAQREPGTKEGQALKIPLMGFDKLGNPIYDWDKAVPMVKENSNEDDLKAQEIRVAKNGDIYLMGSTSYAPQDPVLWMGGGVVRRYNPQGNFLFEYQASNTEKTFSGIETDPDPNSVVKLWTGMHTKGSRVAAWTDDGLMLVHCKPSSKWPFSIDWLDNGSPIYIFTLPKADPGQRYIYVEGVVSAAALRMRVENIDKITRVQENFHWPLLRDD